MMILAASSGSSLDLMYLVCLLLGLFYGIVAGLLNLLGGHLHFGGDHSMDGVGHTPHEVSQMGHEPGAAEAGIHMTPFNPVVITIFLVSFGGMGLATKQLFDWQYASLAVASCSGFVMAGITFAIFEKLFSITQGSSQPSLEELIGKDAEVITPIPENGLGEIAYVCRGSRFTSPARAEAGVAIPRMTAVTMTRVVGTTFYVKPVTPKGS
jgi:membrane protein implicated in regulation of membrane protease activity